MGTKIAICGGRVQAARQIKKQVVETTCGSHEKTSKDNV